MSAARRLVAPILLAAAAGCALQSPPAPEDTRKQALPNLAVPPVWSAEAGAGTLPGGWLASFNDPQLEAMVREALANNPDLGVAAARVEQAAGLVKASGATLYPQVSLMARGGGKMSGDSSGLEGAGVFATWEIDLWGRVRAERATARQQYDATALDTEYARQSIAALVAKSWFLATEARLQRALADEMVTSSVRLASLASDRLRVGSGSEYDLALARANVQTFQDAMHQLDQAYRQALRSLETLAGRYPAAALQVPGKLAERPAPVPAGIPSELLERRPDVVAAERRVAAAFYRVETAKAARLPAISLTASVSTISSELFVLKDLENPIWSVGARLMQPLFLGGALQSQVEVRTAEQKVAVAEYGRIGARAFSEVENALSSEFTLATRVAVLRQAVIENERALELANVRYRVGSTDLRAVQQQQLAVFSARTTLLRVQAEQLVQRVNLYLALGGGWDPEAK